MASAHLMISISASSRHADCAAPGLDAGQGVEGAHERQVHLVLDAMAGHA
jgi:hypothetical protein